MSVGSDSGISIVVMEAGARWPSWFRGLARSGANSLVQAQADGEDERRLVSRVLERAQSVSGRGCVQLCVLACNESTTPRALAARLHIARGLVHSMLASAQGELVMTAEADIDDELRHELLALAGTLCDEFHQTKITVSVRFLSRAPRSAVRLRAVVPPRIAEAG
ncbi:MAG: hypothetical protein JW940_29635 [Polyangiaceae bacterium]|nr:hypothetical protein [Polyangiaceae bacterium]